MMNKNNNSILGNMEIAAFCDQLSMIVAAGISLYEGVSILSEDAEDEQTKVHLWNKVFPFMKHSVHLKFSRNMSLI